MNSGSTMITLSRRQFFGRLSAAVVTCSTSTLLLSGCKTQKEAQQNTSTQMSASAKPQLQSGAVTGPVDIEKHRAFMLMWLLVTGNPSLMNSQSIDYAGLANAVGQHLDPGNVSDIFSKARAHQGYFPKVAQAFGATDPTNPVFTVGPSNVVELVSKLIDPSAPLDHHRALLTSWLLVTTNPDWVDNHCGIDYTGISAVLNGQVTPTDVSNVFSIAKSRANQFEGVGAFFNDSDMKGISGYDNQFYCCRDCPLRMDQVVHDLMNPTAAGTFKEPAGCPSKQLLLKELESEKG